MRPRGLGARAVLAAVVALLLFAPTAALASDTYAVPAGSLVYGQVAGAHGYRIHFSAGERRGRRHFRLSAKGRHAIVSYEVPAGRPVAGGIVADFGRRGRFDLRFVPQGRERPLRLASHCAGGEGRWQRGHLVGIARFHGERGYTDLRLRRIPVISESWPAFRCHYAHGGGQRGKPRRAQVFAHRRGLSLGAVLFSRHSAPAGRRAFFRAWTGGSAGRMWISREVRVPAPESAFLFPGGPKLPEEVTVRPPKPFSGIASFTRTAESTFTWSGDLTVEFPGTGPVRLTGPSFGADVGDLDACVQQDAEREPPA